MRKDNLYKYKMLQLPLINWLILLLNAPSIFSHPSLLEDNFFHESESVLSRHVRQATCNQADRFRTVDGSCNNLKNTLWGKSRTPYNRFLPAHYRDGRDSPGRRRDGMDLPNAREMTLRLTPDLPIENATLSHMFMMWGQFVGHDVTNKPRAIARGADRTEIKCCETPRNQWPDNCFPVMFPQFDPFYSKFNKSCMEFTRSTPFTGQGFPSNQRQQSNGNTCYIDGSTVYGSTATRAKLLRTFQNGLLKSTPQFGKHLLPKNAADCGPIDVKCFEAGDIRVNMFPGLVSMHTLWMREHNRIATILGQLNPHWDDERIYQETRLIVGAMIQHITFKEYLPKLLGPILIDWWGLTLQDQGFYTGYNPTVDPSISNAFSSAAFRYGHSLVQASFKRYTGEHTPLPSPLLGEEFFNNSAFNKPGEVDRILLGLMNERIREMDNFFTSQLTNHLLDGGEGFGDDLVATTIQRGRDHGIPPYNAWREFCGLPRLRSFNDLRDMMSEDNIKLIEQFYGNVDDIELYPAGLIEWHVLGGIIGPTFSCIVAQQFHNLRNGDRFWYENGGKQASFTMEQLNEIRGVTLARVVCDNTDLARTVQPMALQPPIRSNQRVPCRSLRPLDLSCTNF
uniref:Peroxidase n=1 Tax=Strigamia maritima TaxID=126957 RepID=T1J5V8_STRMM